MASDINRIGEPIWIYISVLVLLTLFGVLLYSAFGLGIHVETNISQIQPSQVGDHGAF